MFGLRMVCSRNIWKFSREIPPKRLLPREHLSQEMVMVSREFHDFSLVPWLVSREIVARCTCSPPHLSQRLAPLMVVSFPSTTMTIFLSLNDL